MMDQNCSLSRRELVMLVGMSASALFAPELAFAHERPRNDESILSRIALASPDTVLDLSSLSRVEQDQIVAQRARAEASKIIELLESDTAHNAAKAKGRPSKYSTVYGKPVSKNSGYRLLPGQEKKGVSFSTYSTIYFSISGGGKITLSFGFPAPWGTVSIGVSFGKFLGGNPSVGGYGVGIPGDKKRYKVWLNNEYESVPYTIYHTDAKGKRKVYARKYSTPVIVGHDFDARRI